MTITNVLFVMIMTLFISSGIATIIIELSYEDENVIALFGFGITGNLIALVLYAIRGMYERFKN